MKEVFKKIREEGCDFWKEAHEFILWTASLLIALTWLGVHWTALLATVGIYILGRIIISQINHFRKMDTTGKGDYIVIGVITLTIGCYTISNIGLGGLLFVVIGLSIIAGAVCLLFRFFWQITSIAVIAVVVLGIIGLLLFGIRYLI